ncbi:protein-tyrosine phosphatase-like protein [Microdochium trichocladiopsis]|uniref:Protein-tyrosine phosphatase-like protein n=1 Tax=Microdochium trichocladiopsis TaxID=1682393 RepID=A0A9P8Y6A4_9PEZI|nr:protein-tyrosine phosphatase-like protein [Microdochium trichocladiopsis]KAH7031059.1 protein-tyrosine phosphatase-like protein [Microdochium trichocladiopsis]
MADHASLLKLAETEVSLEITKEQYGPVLTNPPFVYLDGTLNTRDLGLIPDSPLRAGFAYRSGLLSNITDNGRAVLEGKLGIKRVFDLRSQPEREKAPEPVFEGVETTWIPSTRPGSRLDLAMFASGGGEAGYEDMYLEVIEVYVPSWKAILEHVRDRPDEPFLVHCTAGRDRTGVFGGLLLTLAGASEETVTLDYLLSRVGTEPVRLMLLHLRASSWKAFTDGVQKKYGGFVQFAKQELGFSEEDLATIKKNATSPRS